MPQIIIELPDDRHKLGRLWVVDNGQTVFGPVYALGKADNSEAEKHGNPLRNSLLKYGDTPLGLYKFEGIRPTGGRTIYSEKSYGLYGAIVMSPLGGDAWAAMANGRLNIWIHSGALGPNGSLRPTYGCVRLYPKDMQNLVEKLNELQISEGFVDQCSMQPGQGFDVVIFEGQPDGKDAQDPPPFPIMSPVDYLPPHMPPAHAGHPHPGGSSPPSGPPVHTHPTPPTQPRPSGPPDKFHPVPQPAPGWNPPPVSGTVHPGLGWQLQLNRSHSSPKAAVICFSLGFIAGMLLRA